MDANNSQQWTDPFVSTDSEKTEQSPQLIDGDAVASKNTEQIHQQIWNKPNTTFLQPSTDDAITDSKHMRLLSEYTATDTSTFVKNDHIKPALKMATKLLNIYSKKWPKTYF